MTSTFYDFLKRKKADQIQKIFWSALLCSLFWNTFFSPVISPPPPRIYVPPFLSPPSYGCHCPGDIAVRIDWILKMIGQLFQVFTLKLQKSPKTFYGLCSLMKFEMCKWHMGKGSTFLTLAQNWPKTAINSWYSPFKHEVNYLISNDLFNAI